MRIGTHGVTALQATIKASAKALRGRNNCGKLEFEQCLGERKQRQRWKGAQGPDHGGP